MYRADADTDTPPTTIEARLFTSVLQPDGTNDDTGLTDGSYADQDVTFSAASGGSTTLDAVTFPQLSAEETAASIGFFDKSTGDQIDQAVFPGGWTLSATEANTIAAGVIELAFTTES
jgi:hypothetical protein